MQRSQAPSRWLAPVRWAIHHPKLALSIAVLLTVVSSYFGRQISLRSNFSDLLPDDHPAVEQARTLDQVVGGASFIVVTVETQDESAAGHFVDDLRREVLALDGIRYVDDRPPENFFKEHGLLYLSLDDLEEVRERLQRKIEQTKLSQAGVFIDLQEDDESGFDLNRFRSKYGFFLNTQAYYQNSAGTFYVSLIKPEWRTTDVKRSEAFMGLLGDLVTRLKPASYHASMSVRFTGPYVKAMAQQKILRRDAALVSIIALIGAIAYMIFHFRRKRAVFLIAVPLVMSVTWTLALAYAFYGSLNLFSSVVCAVIIGLAADYGIHMYSEYLSERELGIKPEAAFIKAAEHLRRPFFIAATTTAAAFFALSLSRFKAFSEFGMIAGPGILLCALAFTLLMPPLALWLERWLPEKIAQRPPRSFNRIAKGPVLEWLLSRRAFVFVGLCLVIPLLAIFQGRLVFDYNMDNVLGSQPTKALDERVDAIFSNTVNPEVALVEQAEDAPKLAAALRDIKKANQGRSSGTTIQSVLALSDFVPGRQAEKMQKIREIKQLLTPEVVSALGPEDRKSYEDFQVMLQPRRLTPAAVPTKIRKKFEDQMGREGRILFIFPNITMMDGKAYLRYVEEIRSADCTTCVGPYYISGETSVFYEIIKMLFSEGKYVMGLALLAVFLLLWLNFRTLTDTCLVFAPLIVSLLALAGWMALLGLPLTMINLAAFPVVLGIVTDYVVHFYQRYRDHPETSIRQTYQRCFAPILGSTLTTLIGFASLMFADMGGLRSFGALATLGIATGCVTTLFWFPGLLALINPAAASVSELKEDESQAYSA